MYRKEEIYQLLKDRAVEFDAVDHPALWSMSDVCEVEIPHPEADAKNLFLKEKKHDNYFLITVRGDKRVDLKKFREKQGTRALTFGSAEELEELLGVIPGMVSPFGLLNDKDCKVRFFIDREFFDEPYMIGIHPNDNTATVVLRTDDLIKIVQDHGTEITVIDI